MLGLVRAAVLGFALLSVIFVVVSIYSRSVRRERLEKDWDHDPAREGAAVADRDAFIAAGMKEYQEGLRRKLILLVYVVPTIAFVAIVFVINAQ